MFSQEVFKLTRWNLKQDRQLVMTTESLYLFRKKSKKAFILSPAQVGEGGHFACNDQKLSE
jgi:hypothetical protein